MVVAMSTDITNWFEQTNAARLAKRIERFWTDRKERVTVWTERMVGAGVADAYVVRSDMVDGRPRG